MVFEVFKASNIDIVILHFVAPCCLAGWYQTAWYCKTKTTIWTTNIYIWIYGLL